MNKKNKNKVYRSYFFGHSLSEDGFGLDTDSFNAINDD